MTPVSTTDWFRTIQTMQSMAFIGMLCVLLLCGLYMFVEYVRQDRRIKWICVILCFLCGKNQVDLCNLMFPLWEDACMIIVYTLESH